MVIIIIIDLVIFLYKFVRQCMCIPESWQITWPPEKRLDDADFRISLLLSVKAGMIRAQNFFWLFFFLIENFFWLYFHLIDSSTCCNGWGHCPKKEKDYTNKMCL